ncbi:hypothetical protein GCM10022198_12890 [Klugiella xanthotipulae]|uniref:Uncharacterized protein (TIGR00369 family) n=1 Tax=Klugiella xanthotipulae TaxID=244735 RepID=A0A543I450_9MICO|nr:PaaI family thioesterase [Klugiella xanthotipulae]TQM65376.1 uncharacterized protein (TIGR00369 family) [Klugiella xanthotipulae]
MSEQTFDQIWTDFYDEVGIDMAATLSLEPVSGSPEAVSVRMPLTEANRQPAGMFSAPALFGLADITGTFLARYHVPEGVFPFAIQANINLLSNTGAGYATATATLVRAGRSVVVTQTEVRDDQGKLLTTVSATYLPKKVG